MTDPSAGTRCPNPSREQETDRDEYTEAVLDQFTVHGPDAGTFQLVHDPCEEKICDIEEGDTLTVLIAAALRHEETSCPAYNPSNPN